MRCKFLVAQHQITLLPTTDVIEGGLADDGVPGDQFISGRRRHGVSTRPTIPGQPIGPPDSRTVGSSLQFSLNIEPPPLNRREAPFRDLAVALGVGDRLNLLREQVAGIGGYMLLELLAEGRELRMV